MPYKDFQVNEILTAADVNNFLMDQSVMVFADAATRTTALSAVLAEGMLTYLEDTNVVQVYDGTAWTEISGGGGVTVSDTAPASPSEGDLWWDSGDGKLFVYYDDGSSQQWVDAAGPSVAVQSTAPTGYEGQLWLDDTDGSMYVYYTDPGGGSSSWIGAVSRSGGILQVVQAVKSDTFSTTATSFTDIPGLTASITPRSTSSKILVMANVQHGRSDASGSVTFRLNGGNASDYVGDAAGSRTRGVFGMSNFDLSMGGRPELTLSDSSMTYLDSPSTTSTVTYSAQVFVTGSGTVYVNRTGNDLDNSSYARGASSITLIEVAG